MTCKPILAAWLTLVFAAAISTVAQDAPVADPQTGVVLVKLSPPSYPPLARQARIMGDVKVKVHVCPDGSAASADLLSGHPMLAPAAVDSAKKSHYECRACNGETEYVLTYTFGFIEDLKPYDKFEDRPARAGKCFYLWKCGVVRVNSFNICAAGHPPEISQSPGHVKILAFPMCVETMSSASASR